MRARLLPVLFLWTAAAAAHPDSPGFPLQSRVDWKEGVLELTVTRALDPSVDALPRAKSQAASAIDEAFFGLLVQALSTVVADSSRTLGQVASGDSAVFSWVQALARDASTDELALTPDFSRLAARYRIPLFGEHGLTTPLFPAQDSPIPRRLGYVSTRVFSGLVIYARDPLPSVGTGREEAAVPALFPRLLDEQMNVVLERSMCRGEALARWGMVGYADSIDDNEILRRTGQHPLQVAARAVFGKNPVDLVIPTEAARQLLSRAENIDMLKDCRILVIYGSLK
jgi:hypothetical protein